MRRIRLLVFWHTNNRKMKIVSSILICCITIFSWAQNDTSSVVKNKLLEEIVVSGKLSDGLKDQFSNNTNEHLLTDKLLENMSSVTLIKRGNYAQEPTIRGLNAGQINTTIDGIQMFGACTDRMDPISSYVEPINLESINLATSPSGEQFGSGIGGGINFKLKKAELGQEKVFSGIVGAGFESNSNAMRFLGGFQFSKKRFAIQINSIYRKASDYFAGDRQKIDFSAYEKWNVSGNAIFAINSQNSIVLDYLQDDGRNIGYPALTMDVSFANAKIGAISHLLKRTGKKFYALETKLYYNYIDHAMDDTKRPAELVPMHMDMPGTSQTFGFYSNSSWRFGQKQFVKIKMNGFQNDLHAEMTMYPKVGKEMFMLTIPDTRRSLLGIDLSDKWLLSKKVTLEFGGRAEYAISDITTQLGRQTMTSFYSDTITKKHLIWNAFLQSNVKLNRLFFLHGGVSKATRAPTLQELYGFYLFNRIDNFDYLGNPDIKPESSWNFNLGFTVNTKKVSVEGKLFSYFFSNYIAGVKLDDYSPMTIGASGVKTYTNLNSAVLAGFELKGKYNIVKNFQFNTVNSFSYAEDGSHSALPFIPPYKSINQLKYDLKGYVFQVEYIGAASQKHVDFERYGDVPSNEFHILNAGLAKTFKVKRFTYVVQFSANNIFDRVYFEHLDLMSIPRQGRSFELKFTFGF